MVALSEMPPSAPHDGAGSGGTDSARRRVVAIVESPVEVLRPESDLATIVTAFGHVDLLVASEVDTTCEPAPIGVLSVGADNGSSGTADVGRDTAVDGDESGRDEPGCDDPNCDHTDWDESDRDEMAEWAGAVGHADLHLHRLGLRRPLGPSAEDDIVAALSELVGFDPEPGVCCLAPVPAPGALAVERAAQRVAQVYGLPLLRYRCMELSVVTPA